MTTKDGKPLPPAQLKSANPTEAASLQKGSNSDAVDAAYRQQVGKGGEPQETTTDRKGRLTTNFGVPISDNQNSLKAGSRGPTLLEDFVLREKIFHFDHERIPERIVHARGSGAHGTFTVTRAIPELTRAALFQKKGNSCDTFTRFSTVAGSKGSKDTPRDVRGFATKLYTEEGNWDLVANNFAPFFIQDAIKFPDIVHAVKPEQDRMMPQAASAHDTFWDFVSLVPENQHMVMWLMSDRAIPRSFRMMEGFGVHTFHLVNDRDQVSFVKFHWKPRLGMQSLLWDEAVKISGADPDFNRRDLWESIDRGDYPEWDLGIQVFDEKFAAAQPYDVLDATKLIPEEDVPIEFIGTLQLNRNPDNFFAETEQVAFLPTNVPPGIDFSNDPLLQGRLFSYLDTQKSRLGTTNFHQIPINAPRCPMRNFHRDGMMQTQIPKGRANYEPNSLAEGGEPSGPRVDVDHGFRTIALLDELGNEPTAKLRVRAERFADHFTQTRQFYLSQSEVEQGHIVSAFIFELSKCEMPHIRERQLSQLLNVDEDLARRVAAGLGMDLPKAAPAAKPAVKVPPSPELSIQKDKRTPKGRKLGILVTDGADGRIVEALKSAAEAAGAAVMVVSDKVAGPKLASGKQLPADGLIDGQPSTVFDAVAVVASEAGCQQLMGHKPAVDWVSDAFAHLKAIAATDEAMPLLQKANVEPDDFVMAASSPDQLVKLLCERNWAREKKTWMQH
ncbi:catalase [Paracoccus sp. Z118]|uniref:catalase n=1 Tax=Paracoccus sp. Z118 TaxID=2851017 RepID=UPI001C2C0883|nr:catalase [Paracoccus sp. Z118]MBV0891061.1 catalase [Paracoccus sp. Z118]